MLGKMSHILYSEQCLTLLLLLDSHENQTKGLWCLIQRVAIVKRHIHSLSLWKLKKWEQNSFHFSEDLEGLQHLINGE